MNDSYDIAAGVVTLAAFFSFLNYKYLHFPHAIGMTVLGVAFSACMALLQAMLPGLHSALDLGKMLTKVDFNRTLMNGMLSFLLFAGALELDMAALRTGRRAVIILSIVGTLISTVVIGYLIYAASRLIGLDLPPEWSLMFGALISPTDPVAVIAILRKAGTPLDVETRVCGESLFNDGVGVVLFSIAYAAAVSHNDVGPWQAASMFLFSGVGGLAFGTALGWLGYKSLKIVDDPPVETLITLALVMGGYALSERMGFSPVVALASAGVTIAVFGKPAGMSDRSRAYVLGFWETIDGLLNAILFLLIGLEIIAIPHSLPGLTLAALAIPIVLISRTMSVGLPFAVVRLFTKLDIRSLPIFIWGGLRGGIPIALALSLPIGERSSTILTVTYGVVLFSLIVQGLTLKPLAQRLYGRPQ